MKYQEINGDLISLSLQGAFDIIAHGCNFEQNADYNGATNIKEAGTSAINANLNQ